MMLWLLQNNQAFSTRDRDNDRFGTEIVLLYLEVHGGTMPVLHSNLNGKYVAHTPEDGGSVAAGANRLSWYTSGSEWAHFTKVQMKVRPKRCTATTSTCG